MKDFKNWQEAELFGKAIPFRDKGQIQKAIEVLKNIIQQSPDYSLAYVILGGIYFDSDNYSDAIPYFEKAVKLTPKTELASIGLFHCLWSLGRNKEALKEARRYLDVGKPAKHYSSLLKEMREMCQACAVEDGDTRVEVPDAGRAVSGGKPAQTASS